MKLQNVIHILIGIVCFALLPVARAVVPPPDGGYPNFTTAEGTNALQNLTIGVGNTAAGWRSLFANTTGNLNTAIGAGTLLFNTGDNNTASGALALLSNTTGAASTANGAFALLSNTTGSGNTGSGYQALYSNQTGANNAAYGYVSLYNNTASFNTAFGSQTLVYNTNGGQNTATGYQALVFNTTGAYNTASGYQALYSNTIGNENTASGDGALHSNQSGANNTAVGRGALGSNTTGSLNTALGDAAGSNVTAANNVICIGGQIAGADVSNTTWIGNVYGVTTQSGITAPVIVSDGGQLGTVASSERFKKDIATMERASEAIMSLRPVTFHYKTDSKDTPQFGLIAEEVAKVNPALVLPDKDGKPFTVRYDAVNAMLLNEFLKEHRKNEQQEATIAELRQQIEALTEGLQKVTAQLEASKPAPQVVNNP
jgi:hypothetical protein